MLIKSLTYLANLGASLTSCHRLLMHIFSSKREFDGCTLTLYVVGD